MFSGIVETTARVVAIKRENTNIHFTFECPFGDELGIDQSVAHNGVCLTVVSREGKQYVVTAMDETLKRSNLGVLKEGDEVNVERSMMMNGRLDGHMLTKLLFAQKWRIWMEATSLLSNMLPIQKWLVEAIFALTKAVLQSMV